MFTTEREGWGRAPYQIPERDFDCEDCGRSIILRFPDSLPRNICESCEADWMLLNEQGKLKVV